jgi:hypothetical protein
MKWFLGTYTIRFNRRHKLSGHLFGGRYKALAVDGSGNGYLRTVCDYVHLNPARAKWLTPDQRLRDFRWSSFVEYLKPAAQRPQWLRVDRLLGELGIPKDSVAGRRELERATEERRALESDADYARLRRGWCWGDPTFRDELLEAVGKYAGESHSGAQRQESAEDQAQRIVREELARLGWTETELQKRAKGDKSKVRIARRLRAETTVTHKRIAKQLHMGTWTHVTHLLYQR